ncbi:MAG: DNA polymerase III subunit alpha, partial [Lentisphaerae bacterium]|nr:DNA polymerase III subunit alpha [Lentisphaerota bacterium]
HEVLLCLQTQTVMSDPKRMRYESREFYLKTRAEMDALFKDFPGAVDRTLDIAERCNFEFAFGEPHFPTFTVANDTTQKKYLFQLGINGVKERYGIADPLQPGNDQEKKIMDRFNMEFDVIEKTGYINYYLVVWDFVNYARQSHIPVGLRGSGGASLIAYTIGITDIDPLAYGLVFERFLNPERVSPPDFDIDFCQYRRGEVIEYVKEKYGRENVAQIITFGSLGAKLVIRDIGRVLEIPYAKCDQLSKMVPDDPKMTLRTALEMSPEFKKAYDTDNDCKNILDYGFVLEGLYRNPGTHAAGVVIGEKPLVELVPLARDKDKEPVTQYTMEPLSEIGLLKMDFLGLRTLSVIQETIELVKKSRGIDINLDKLPEHDDATYKLFNRGDTIGVFQLESTGMRDLIRRVGIDCIEDLIAMIALYRPGPMNMLDDYVNRKTGKAKVKYDHPLLEPILRETYGVMLYQEQIQKAANVLAGYSLGQGDILRRAMSKKKQSEMDKQRSDFVEGCAKNKISAKLAGRIFDSIAKFAGYGFNKSHSTAYAIVAYRTAYLKANYPAEFMAALLSSEMNNFDKLPVFIAESEEMGLKILPPDINESGVRFGPDNGAIRFGLAGIKNVGESAALGIVTERNKNGRFNKLIDFCSRIDSQVANKKVIESLARCGAFDSTGIHRARVFNGIDFAMSRAINALNDQRSGQGNLFDLMDDNNQAIAADEIPDCEEWHESVLLEGEKELLGIYMSGHPLTQYASVLERYQMSSVENLQSLANQTMTRVGGIVSSINKKVVKASKELMAIVQIEDLDGTINVTVFPEAYQKFGAHITIGAAILVCGEVSRKDEQLRLIAYEIYPLRDTPRYFAEKVSIHIPTAHMKNGILEKIRDVLKLHPGTTPVSICLIYPSGEKVFINADRTLNVLPDDAFIHEIEHILGKKSVYVATISSPCLRPKPTRNRRNNASKSP